MCVKITNGGVNTTVISHKHNELFCTCYSRIHKVPCHNSDACNGQGHYDNRELTALTFVNANGIGKL